MRWYALRHYIRRIGCRLAMLRWRLGIERDRDRERVERFDRALADLPEIDRVIFLMARRDGLSFVDIARRLAIPIPDVQVRFAHALERVARALGDLRLSHPVSEDRTRLELYGLGKRRK